MSDDDVTTDAVDILNTRVGIDFSAPEWIDIYPALASLAMRERAADKAVRKMKFYEKKSNLEPTSYHAFDECSTALGYFSQELRKLPTDFTNVELLAAAIQLPEVRALVDAATNLANWAEQTRSSGDAVFWNWRNGDEYSNTLAALAPFMKGGE